MLRGRALPWVIVLALGLACGLAYGSAARAETRAGAHELSADLSFQSDSVTDSKAQQELPTTVFGGQASWGYFLSQASEVGAFVSQSISNTQVNSTKGGRTSFASNSISTALGALYRHYYNPAGNWVPYVGAQVGFVTFSSSSTLQGQNTSSRSSADLMAGVSLGLRYFFSKDAAFDLDGMYNTTGTNVVAPVVFLGISYFL